MLTYYALTSSDNTITYTFQIRHGEAFISKINNKTHKVEHASLFTLPKARRTWLALINIKHYHRGC